MSKFTTKKLSTLELILKVYVRNLSTSLKIGKNF